MRSAPSVTGRGPSEDGLQLATGGYASRNVSGSITGVGAAPTSMGRHRSSVSKGSVSGVGAGEQRSSYDLNILTTTPNRSRQSDPFTSVPGGSGSTGTSPGSASDLTRGPSASRLARKPVPKYDSDTSPTDTVSPTSPHDRANVSSKPPVSGQSRTRTYSNGSHGSYSYRLPASSSAAGAASIAPSSSRNSFETAHNVERKDSHSTLGGAFKFAGEKEGPIHYLIPDPPPSSSL